MVTELVSLSEIRGEIKDMLSVCFEGEAIDFGESIKLKLPNGQSFCIEMKEM